MLIYKVLMKKICCNKVLKSYFLTQIIKIIEKERANKRIANGIYLIVCWGLNLISNECKQNEPNLKHYR